MRYSVDCHASMCHGPFSVSPLLLLFLDAITYICVACSGKRRLHHLSGIVIWQPEVNEAVEVIQDFWVAKNRCSPVGVDAALEICVGLGNLLLERRDVHGVQWRMTRVAHVNFVVWERGEVCHVCLLAS